MARQEGKAENETEERRGGIVTAVGLARGGSEVLETSDSSSSGGVVTITAVEHANALISFRKPVRDLLSWVLWSVVTGTNYLTYKLASSPSSASFVVSWVCSEFAHVSFAVHFLFVQGLRWVNPRLMRTFLGKAFLGFNIVVLLRQLGLSLESLRSASAYGQALRAKGVDTTELESRSLALIPMIMSILSGGRWFLPKKDAVVSTSQEYADLKTLDPNLYLRNRRTLEPLKKLNSFMRGRISKWLELDILENKERRQLRGEKLMPVLCYVHGGGWSLGDKNFACRPMLEYIAATQDIVVVTVNYRLSPEAVFPSHLMDVKRAIVWIRQNIKKYGGDPSRIAVAGESAGGHLSSMIALTGNDPAYQPQELKDGDTSVQACIDIYGVHDFLDIEKHYHRMNNAREGQKPGIMVLSERIVLQESVKYNEKAFRKASPLHVVDEKIAARKEQDKIPPMLVIHGSHDTLAALDDSKLFFDRLQEFRAMSKTKVSQDVFVEIPGGHHAFGYFRTPRSISTALAISAFIKHHLPDVKKSKL